MRLLLKRAGLARHVAFAKLDVRRNRRLFESCCENGIQTRIRKGSLGAVLLVITGIRLPPNRFQRQTLFLELLVTCGLVLVCAGAHDLTRSRWRRKSSNFCKKLQRCLNADVATCTCQAARCEEGCAHKDSCELLIHHSLFRVCQHKHGWYCHCCFAELPPVVSHAGISKNGMPENRQSL